MSSLNRVTLLGHLGKDPELSYTKGGMAVAKFSLATDDRRKDANGDWVSVAEWHSIVLFDRKAEIAGEYLRKGSTRLNRRLPENVVLGRQGNRTEALEDGSRRFQPGASRQASAGRRVAGTDPSAGGQHNDHRRRYPLLIQQLTSGGTMSDPPGT